MPGWNPSIRLPAQKQLAVLLQAVGRKKNDLNGGKSTHMRRGLGSWQILY